MNVYVTASRFRLEMLFGTADMLLPLLANIDDRTISSDVLADFDSNRLRYAHTCGWRIVTGEPILPVFALRK